MSIVEEKVYTNKEKLEDVRMFLKKKYNIQVDPDVTAILVQFFPRSNYIRVQQVVPVTETKGKIEIGRDRSILKDFHFEEFPTYRKVTSTKRYKRA